jgi:hypothetical protein
MARPKRLLRERLRDLVFPAAVLTLLVLAGCGTLDISEEQIERIAEITRTTATTVGGTAVGVVTDPYVPGTGAGIGAVLGLGLAAGVRMLLKALQKKPSA